MLIRVRGRYFRTDAIIGGVLFVLAAIVFAAISFFATRPDRGLPQQCRNLYERARTHAETLAIDGRRIMSRETAPPRCGVFRMRDSLERRNR